MQALAQDTGNSLATPDTLQWTEGRQAFLSRGQKWGEGSGGGKGGSVTDPRGEVHHARAPRLQRGQEQQREQQRRQEVDLYVLLHPIQCHLLLPCATITPEPPATRKTLELLSRAMSESAIRTDVPFHREGL